MTVELLYFTRLGTFTLYKGKEIQKKLKNIVTKHKKLHVLTKEIFLISVMIF